MSHVHNKNQANISTEGTIVVGECAISCVEDETTTCYTHVSSLISNTIDITFDDEEETKTRQVISRSSNTLGIYCLLGDLSEGTSGASPVMCMSGQKCKVS